MWANSDLQLMEEGVNWWYLLFNYFGFSHSFNKYGLISSCFVHYYRKTTWPTDFHKIPWTKWFKEQNYIFSEFWRLEVQDQGVSRFDFLWSSLSFWLADASSQCVLTWPSFYVGSHGMSVSLNFFLQEHQSDWIRAHSDSLDLTWLLL